MTPTDIRSSLRKFTASIVSPPSIQSIGRIDRAELTIPVNAVRVRNTMILSVETSAQDLTRFTVPDVDRDLVGTDGTITETSIPFSVMLHVESVNPGCILRDLPRSTSFDQALMDFSVAAEFDRRWTRVAPPYAPPFPLHPPTPNIARGITEISRPSSDAIPFWVPELRADTRRGRLLPPPKILVEEIGDFALQVRRISLALSLRRLVGGIFLPDDFEPVQKGIVTSEVRQSRRAATPETTGNKETPKEGMDESSEAISLWKLLYFILLPPLEELKTEFAWPSDIWLYQREGVHFLLRNHHALLADEMGLGKTIQAIVASQILLRLKVIERVLIVCPASLKVNWYREFMKWAPELFVHIVQGSQQERLATWRKPFAHVTIANYEQVRNDHASMVRSRLPFDVVVLDEAQRIKNRGSQTARAVKKLHREYSWCLTGTPLENSVDELISVLEFVKPDLLDQESSLLKAEMKQHITTNSRSRTPQPVQAWEIGLIQRLMQPHFLRRKKVDVLKDLPDKIYTDQVFELEGHQRFAYKEADENGRVYLKELGRTVTLQHVLALIQKLKQLCNFDPETRESVKLDFLKEELESVFASGQKALLFSQFTVSRDGGPERTLEFLQKELAEYRPLIYHGGMSADQRISVIDEFKEDPKQKLLLLSLKAGGLGLNLENASYVFHFDRWWNPAVEKQAEDRAHRFGQTQPVNVYRFIVKDTIEEKIDAKLRRKQALFDEVIEGTPQAETYNLTPEELFEIVGLDPELARVKRKRTESETIESPAGNITPRAFEVAISELYRAMGFNVELTQESRDGGVDIYARRVIGGLVTKVAIQCKLYEGTVGIAEAQRLWGILQDDTELSDGVLVTTGRFSTGVKNFANGKRLTLIDKKKLEELLEEHHISMESFVEEGAG